MRVHVSINCFVVKLHIRFLLFFSVFGYLTKKFLIFVSCQCDTITEWFFPNVDNRQIIINETTAPNSSASWEHKSRHFEDKKKLFLFVFLFCICVCVSLNSVYLYTIHIILISTLGYCLLFLSLPQKPYRIWKLRFQSKNYIILCLVSK